MVAQYCDILYTTDDIGIGAYRNIVASDRWVGQSTFLSAQFSFICSTNSNTSSALEWGKMKSPFAEIQVPHCIDAEIRTERSTNAINNKQLFDFDWAACYACFERKKAFIFHEYTRIAKGLPSQRRNTNRKLASKRQTVNMRLTSSCQFDLCLLMCGSIFGRHSLSIHRCSLVWNNLGSLSISTAPHRVADAIPNELTQNHNLR